VGEIARSRGHYNQAEAQYREYSRLGERLVALEPDNLKWRMENLYGIEDVGIALYDERRFDEAAKQFTSALGPMRNLLAIDPTNQTYQKEFSTVLAWLADTQRSRGQLEAASSLRDQQVSWLEKSAGSGTTNVAFREQLIPAHEALGILLASRGLTDKALVQLQAAVDEADRLIPVDPTNARWKQYGAAAHLELAKTLLFAGKGGEAAAQTDAGCNALAQVGSHDAAPARTRLLRSDCLAIRSRLAVSRNDTVNAERLAEQSLASTREERSGDPVIDRYRIAGAYRLLGDVRRIGRDARASIEAWSAGLDQLPAGVTERPWETFEHAALLERLGRTREAAPLQQRLASIGYRSII